MIRHFLFLCLFPLALPAQRPRATLATSLDSAARAHSTAGVLAGMAVEFRVELLWRPGGSYSHSVLRK